MRKRMRERMRERERARAREREREKERVPAFSKIIAARTRRVLPLIEPSYSLDRALIER